MSRYKSAFFAKGWMFSAAIIWTGNVQALGFEYWINRATDIAVVTVTSGEALQQAPHRACAFHYRLQIDRNVRGLAPQQIYTDAGLTVGGRYLLVYFEAEPWPARVFATDLPLPLSETKRPAACDELRGKAALIRDAEIRPLRRPDDKIPESLYVGRGMRIQSDWVEFPPHLFPGIYSSLTRVSDVDRIEVRDYQPSSPPFHLHDYIPLSELIASVRTQAGQSGRPVRDTHQSGAAK